VRCGFTSRTQVIREQGFSPETIDNQQADERAHAAMLGLIYDSDPNKVLIGRETVPLTETPVTPGAASDEDESAESEPLGR
jgi:capsid protein